MRRPRSWRLRRSRAWPRSSPAAGGPTSLNVLAPKKQIRTPTLLLVGDRDDDVLALNRQALAELPCDKCLTLIPGASHLFEEPGTLDDVAAHACEWFCRHLRSPTP